MDDYKQLTFGQLYELEQWMYDQDALHGENYYDERMKLLQYIKTRMENNNAISSMPNSPQTR